MERITVDEKRGFDLAIFFKDKENFQIDDSSMLRLIHVAEGSGIIKLNNQILIFSAPAIFTINEMDEFELMSHCNMSAEAVYFHPTIINDAFHFVTIRNENAELSMSEYRDYILIAPFIERQSSREAFIEIGPITSKRIEKLFQSIKNELALLENEFWPCRSRSFLFETLFLIQNMITDSRNKEKIDLPEPAEDISDIILYLHTNYDRKITIEELTDAFHINRTTLSERFRRAVGLSIMEYLVKYRIKMASVMLRDTRLPISEILVRVGFTDSVHFARMFKKHTGYTPSGYREKY